MIGRLTGRIVEEGEGGSLVVDVAGVGYEVIAPLGTKGRVETGEDGVMTLHIHTHVREDALSLFGFASQHERDAFRTIIGVSNVGPKLGLAVLGSVSVSELALAVARGETPRLTAIPGVGKKTAERLVLELKGKLDPTVPSNAQRTDRASPAITPSGKNQDLLVSALTRMGYRPAEADRAVATLAAAQSLDGAPLGDLMREALAVLAK